MPALSESLPAPSVHAALSQWSLQPVALAAALAAALWWGRGVLRLRRRGIAWPARRTVALGLGLTLFVWVTNGFPQAYATSVFSVFVSQSLLLLLVVPAAVMTAQPVQLARSAYGADSVIPRFLRSRLGRLLSSPFVGPLIVPLVCAAIFFGSVPGWVDQYRAVDWLLAIGLSVLGVMIVLPLLAPDLDSGGSLAVGLALGVGLFELMLDAVPGIVMRLQTQVSSTFFDERATHVWSVPPLRDQQGAGATLWAAAELLDLPFLLLIFYRWVRADAYDAAQIDTVLDAERISRRALPGSPGDAAVDPSGDALADQPWWLTDPAMQERIKRRG